LKGKQVFQLIGGVLLLISFFFEWLYAGGFTYIKPVEIASNPGNLAFKSILLFPLLGIVQIVLGVTKKNSFLLTAGTIIIAAIGLGSVIYELMEYAKYNAELSGIQRGRDLTVTTGFYIAVFAVISLFISLFLPGKDKIANNEKTLVN
jgi:hypothetical protein